MTRLLKNYAIVLMIGLLSVFVLSNCQTSSSSSTSTPTSSNAGDLTSYQWHLMNTGQSAFASETGTAGEDINQEVTHNSGITGSGIIVAVIDSGLEITHSDLKANVVAGGSWDFYGGDSDPTDIYFHDGDHGTSVAGLIAAADNSIGGRGVAPGASLKGFNAMLASVTATTANFIDALGGSSSNPNSTDVDIFNMSYGYVNTMDNVIDSAIEAQLIYAVNNLRSGKGAIFVKAAGNGFDDFGDDSTNDAINCNDAQTKAVSCQNVNMDPEAATPWMINVGALNADGVKSSYSTAGSGIWISAPGGEYGNDQTNGWLPYPSNPIEAFQPAMITTDQSGCDIGYSRSSYYPHPAPNRFQNNSNGLNDGCNFTSTFNGTSSAAPVTSGAVALLLESNPNLTWRDVKYILARTSRKVDATRGDVTTDINGSAYVVESGWTTNDGTPDTFSFHNWYGFGALDVDAAVSMATGYSSNWGPLEEIDATADGLTIPIPDNSVDGTADVLTIGQDKFIESVQVIISITHPNIGELAIELTSPSSTTSILLNLYNGFSGSADLAQMALISNAFYGERSAGDWTLKVIDGDNANAGGTLTAWELKIYGH